MKMKNVELTIDVEFIVENTEKLEALRYKLESLIENIIYDELEDADEIWATCDVFVDEDEEEEEEEE